MRDDNLIQKPCHSLESILGDTLISSESEKNLLEGFWPKLQFDGEGEQIEDWPTNASEAEVISFTDLRSG